MNVEEPLTCPRCKRAVHPWPIPRPAKCSPAHWAHCIRNDDPSTWKGGAR